LETETRKHTAIVTGALAHSSSFITINRFVNRFLKPFCNCLYNRFLIIVFQVLYVTMETTKKCPQCDQRFIGRANRIYCSEKCKMNAFKASTSRTGGDLPSGTHPLPSHNLTPTTHHSVSFSEESLRLQVELRRLELEYAQRMKQFEAEESDPNWNVQQLSIMYSKQKLRN
jgi:hypothetical protein